MTIFPLFFSNKYNQLKSFFGNISTESEKTEHLSLNKSKTQSYINFDITIEEKILSEKRRRYQAYMAMDYLLSVISYFDFFSIDAFKIAKKAKELGQFFEKKSVTSEIVLLPFFKTNLEISNILEKYGINEKEVTEIIYGMNKIVPKSFKEKRLKNIKNLFLKIDIPMLSEYLIVSKPIQYSYETNQIFEKAAENALTRFKTPIVNSEILLITMLEAKKSTVGKLLKRILKNDTNWYMLRYSLMKRLHTQELAIRTNIPANHQYFAYLLKANLPELHFDTLIEKDCLLPGILLFRNTMILDIVNVDLYQELKKDILASIKSTHVRTYST